MTQNRYRRPGRTGCWAWCMRAKCQPAPVILLLSLYLLEKSLQSITLIHVVGNYSTHELVAWIILPFSPLFASYNLTLVIGIWCDLWFLWLHALGIRCSNQQLGLWRQPRPHQTGARMRLHGWDGGMNEQRRLKWIRLDMVWKHFCWIVFNAIKKNERVWMCV